MAMSMDGGILIGLARPYILLLETKQSGKYKTYQTNHLVTNDLSNLPFWMHVFIWFMIYLSQFKY
jgi:hypothetical protein